MAFNYFVAYDLIPPGQHYDKVRDRIRSLGRWSQIQYSLFYLKSGLTTQQVHDSIRQVMDVNDKLAVIYAADAYISNYPFDALNSLSAIFSEP